MPQTVINCQDIKKRYRLGQTASPDTLRDAISGVFGRGRSTAPDADTPADDREFWALKGVSFQVQRGECLGIIGHNGAGKSTLLKVLARITEPTAGRIEMQGRVAALLEVGTGFHPELTGLENTYLNGSILGMTRKEVRAKLADIVDFAGTEKFMNTPVKRYSSGMRVRLGFAVAAHLDPEILIIDEVLAVGDVLFQERCIKRMNDITDSGRTVVFVSHQMGTIQKLTSRCLVMNTGQVIADLPTNQAVALYFKKLLPETQGTQRVESKCGSVAIGNAHVEKTPGLDQPLKVRCTLEARDAIGPGRIGLTILNSHQTPIVTTNSDYGSMHSGRYHVEFVVEQPRLLPGDYQLHVSMNNRGQGLMSDRFLSAFQISAHGYDDQGLLRLGDAAGTFLHIPAHFENQT
ncbi:MAG: polysaccharide ABC transporter ATP-binding protein [Planctomycetota bacterium]